MSNQRRISPAKSLKILATRLRDYLRTADFILLFAYNATGKTRLSTEFKDFGKRKGQADTLYFNAFTEDLFSWDNDLENDKVRRLRIEAKSQFFSGLGPLEMESRIRPFLWRYADFDFRIDYEKWEVRFIRKITVRNVEQEVDYIKVSRGEENLFSWCFYLAIAQATIDGDANYNWVKFLYIDDPVSSLDDNNAIAIAYDLAQELKRGKGRVQAVVSTHHSLFYNVMWNELKLSATECYFLHRNHNGYFLQSTDDTPFFHHVARLGEIKKAIESGDVYPHHFNVMRTIMEKTATFFGKKDFSECIKGLGEQGLYTRALNLLSHGGYSVFEPSKMDVDTAVLFARIFNGFLSEYPFLLPGLEPETTSTSTPS